MKVYLEKAVPNYFDREERSGIVRKGLVLSFVYEVIANSLT